MCRFLTCVLSLILSTYCFSGDDNPVDTTSYIYEFDMKYTGSQSRVDPNYQYVLNHLVEIMQKDTLLHIHVRGHVCCGPGFRLSRRRAKKAYKYLIKFGIPKNRITYKGYSDEVPIVFPEKTDEDEKMNRRVDFLLQRKVS